MYVPRDFGSFFLEFFGIVLFYCLKDLRKKKIQEEKNVGKEKKKNKNYNEFMQVFQRKDFFLRFF